MKKVLGMALCALLAALFAFVGCSGGDDNPAVFFPPSDVADGGAGTGDGTSGGGTSGGGSGTETGGTAISPEDKAKSDAELVKEGNAALTDGDYDKAVSKFNAAYQKNPSDQNKIYYTLTDLAMLSVDDTIVDLMKNKLGMTKYPATLNALINTAWAKDKTQQPLGSGWNKTFPVYRELTVTDVTQADDGNLIRVSGELVEKTSENSEKRWVWYFLDGNDWIEQWTYTAYKQDASGKIYLLNATPDANGKYLVSYNSTKDASAPASCRYKISGTHKKAVEGTHWTLPELAIPSWVTDQDYYKSTLIGATQTMQTWGYLLYANIISNNESGVNDVVDKLLPLIHKKSEEVKKTVDSLGDGTAKIEASFLATLNLKEILGEDDITIGKIEMNALAAALEGVDAVLNYAASYDLSANLKAAETDGSSYSNALKIIRNCVTAKTLAVRDAEKMTTSKTLLVDALGRLISSYEDMKVSTSYPQVVKEGIAQYGDILHDGAVKAKAAIENGSVFYIPKELTGKTFPTDLASAALGVDMGKIFTPGYWTSLVERSSDSTIKFYYKRVQYVFTSTSNPISISDNTTESELTEIADIDAFCNTTTSDAGSTVTKVTEGGVTTTKQTTIYYRVGILLNQSVLSDVFPSVENVAEKMKFVDFIGIN